MYTYKQEERVCVLSMSEKWNMHHKHKSSQTQFILSQDQSAQRECSYGQMMRSRSFAASTLVDPMCCHDMAAVHSCGIERSWAYHQHGISYSFVAFGLLVAA